MFVLAGTREQWKILAAGQLGWMLDAMDVMLYAFALNAIREEFHLSAAGAGALASVPLLTGAAGGVLFGVLADRIGRVRALVYSILTYSLFTGLTATSGGVGWLVFWRALVGLGLGGEWSAGSVLVAESWPAEHRGKAIGLMQAGWAVGYILAAALAALILPRWGWRALFLVGVTPALLTVWVRRSIPEPALWSSRSSASPRKLFRPPLLRKMALASLLATCVLFAYWGLFTWMPSFLATPLERGGAGMSVVRSSVWIVPMQIGAFFGYTLFGFLADRYGRRPVFVFFVLAAGVLAPLYGSWARHETLLMALGPLVGFFGHGYFSVFGALLAELFPSGVRGTAQGVCYNVGRALSALAPASVGALADRLGIGSALALVSVFFLAAAVVMLALPETRGEQLA